MSLAQQPDQPAVLDKLMRASYSIKGAARAVGLDAAVSLANAAEEQLERARLGHIPVTPELIDALLAASDLFQRIGAAASMGLAAPADTLVTACAERVALSSAGGVFETPRAATADFDETAEPTGVAQPSTVEPAVSVPLLASEDDRVLRIRAGQLSRLVALSGELVVESGQMHILAAAQQRMRVKQLQIADLLADLQQLIAAQPAAYALHSGIQAMRMQLNDLRVSSTDWSQQFEQHARRKEDLSMRRLGYRRARCCRVAGDHGHRDGKLQTKQ